MANTEPTTTLVHCGRQAEHAHNIARQQYITRHVGTYPGGESYSRSEGKEMRG